jgi:hypothetical protein
MARMTEAEAKTYALQYEPDVSTYFPTKEKALQYELYLNYLTDSDDYHAVFYAPGMWIINKG